MKMNYKILIALCYLFFVASIAQEKDNKAIQNEIFKLIEQGIKNSNISFFSGFFGKQIYLSLKDGESGVFSANQAYYVLQKYLSNRKIVSFHFTSFGYAEQIPFAVGNLVFKYKSSHVFTNVYISLTYVDEQWVIDKINFY